MLQYKIEKILTKKEALICGPVSYHDYAGILVDENMRKKIAEGILN